LGASVEGKMIHQGKLELENKQPAEKLITLIPTASDKQSSSSENDIV